MLALKYNAGTHTHTQPINSSGWCVRALKKSRSSPSKFRLPEVHLVRGRRARARASGCPARCLPSAHPQASSPPADRPPRMSHPKVGQESRVRWVTKRDHEGTSFSQSPETFSGGGERRSESRASLVGSLMRLRDVLRWRALPFPRN